MKLTYITNARLPTEWAHGLQIMKTCEALAAEGISLELWAPRKKLTIKESPFSYYRVKENFPIRRFFTIDLMHLGTFGFLLQTFSFAVSLLFTFAFQARTHRPLVYCRDEIIIAFLCFFGIRRIAWESHDGAWNRFGQFAAKKAEAIVVVSAGLKDFYVEKGIDASKIHVIPNGIDLEEFAHPESQEDSRKRLGLPLDKKIALYIGMLERWKGTDTLLKASAFLPSDILVAVIGGENEMQVARLQSEYPHVAFLGYRPAKELPDNQAAADALILPNTGVGDISVRFTSPLKLFAYMASGKPIVASDLPSIRELVSAESAFLVTADDPKALAQGIVAAVTGGEGIERAGRAYDLVKGYTWEARAKKVLELIMTELKS